MIQTLLYKEREDGVKLYVTFSDEGYIIEKISSERKEFYRYAIDVGNNIHEYQESDKLISHTAMQVWQMEILGVKYWIPSMEDVKVK